MTEYQKEGKELRHWAKEQPAKNKATMQKSNKRSAAETSPDGRLSNKRCTTNETPEIADNNDSTHAHRRSVSIGAIGVSSADDDYVPTDQDEETNINPTHSRRRRVSVSHGFGHSASVKAISDSSNDENFVPSDQDEEVIINPTYSRRRVHASHGYEAEAVSARSADENFVPTHQDEDRSLVLDNAPGSNSFHELVPSRIYEEAAREGLLSLAMTVLDREKALLSRPSVLIPTPSIWADKDDAAFEPIYEIMKVYAAMDKRVLISLINGTLPKLKFEDPDVAEITQPDRNLSTPRPCVYRLTITERDTRCSPSPAQLRQVIEVLLLYCSDDNLEALTEEQRNLIYTVDAKRNSIPWSADDLKTHFFRHYLIAPVKDDRVTILVPSITRTAIVKEFCQWLLRVLNALQEMNPEADNSPIPFVLGYTGVTVDFHRLMQEHAGNNPDSYIMPLVTTVLDTLYPGKYYLDESVVMLVWDKGQAPIAEAAVHRLTSSYAWEGTGFNTEGAGLRYGGDKDISDQQWEIWMRQAYEQKLRTQLIAEWSPYSD